MSDELRIDSAVSIKLFFEWKNHQSFIHILAQQPHPSLPPRPELRANVIHDWNPALLHLPRHTPVERRRINDHGQVRPSSIRLSD